jgi:hypothetical protein
VGCTFLNGRPRRARPPADAEKNLLTAAQKWCTIIKQALLQGKRARKTL